MLKEYAKVKLKDGKEGYIIEVSEKLNNYMVELSDYEIIDVKPDDIAEVLKE